MRNPLQLLCVFGLLTPFLPDSFAAEPAPSARIVPSTGKELITFTDLAKVRARRPLLIAHRGGVVSHRNPECSLAAIRDASKWGYDMVELDVRETKDGVPVVFHDGNLKAACGRDATIGSLNAAEVLEMPYRKNGEKIASLDQALALCRTLHLGFMLDLKDTPPRVELLRKIAALVRKHRLEQSTVTISGHPLVRQELRSVALVPVNAEELKQIANGDRVSLQGLYWFGIPAWIPFEQIPKLQAAGALVFPAINTFRYEKDPDRAQAREDVRRLNAIGADGYQIDSAYQDFFGRPLPE